LKAKQIQQCFQHAQAQMIPACSGTLRQFQHSAQAVPAFQHAQAVPACSGTNDCLKAKQFQQCFCFMRQNRYSLVKFPKFSKTMSILPLEAKTLRKLVSL